MLYDVPRLGDPPVPFLVVVLEALLHLGGKDVLDLRKKNTIILTVFKKAFKFVKNMTVVQ